MWEMSCGSQHYSPLLATRASGFGVSHVWASCVFLLWQGHSFCKYTGGQDYNPAHCKIWLNHRGRQDSQRAVPTGSSRLARGFQNGTHWRCGQHCRPLAEVWFPLVGPYFCLPYLSQCCPFLWRLCSFSFQVSFRRTCSLCCRFVVVWGGSELRVFLHYDL